jgi:hypothetical protein
MLLDDHTGAAHATMLNEQIAALMIVTLPVNVELELLGLLGI